MKNWLTNKNKWINVVCVLLFWLSIMGMSITIILHFTAFNAKPQPVLEPIVLTQPEINSVANKNSIDVKKLYEVLRKRNPNLKYNIEFNKRKTSEVKINYEKDGGKHSWIYKLHYD
ncbi:hypothetical protein [Williamsoniiplasma luminosum]|nr:hypothetical protein [Williamsoniiplasma luminosum]